MRFAGGSPPTVVPFNSVKYLTMGTLKSSSIGEGLPHRVYHSILSARED
jgi:hypothetical protein